MHIPGAYAAADSSARGSIQPLQPAPKPSSALPLRARGSSPQHQLFCPNLDGVAFNDYQWKPGQSGNPKGGVKRAPRRSLEQRLRQLMDRTVAVEIAAGGEATEEVLGSEELADVFWAQLHQGHPAFWALALKHMPATFLPMVSGDDAQAAAVPQLPVSLAHRTAKLKELARIIHEARYDDALAPAGPAPGANGHDHEEA